LSNPVSAVFTSAPASGKQLKVYRETDRSTVYKTFDNGPLNATDMTNSFKKILFIEQEAFDKFLEVEALFSDSGNLPTPNPNTQANDWLLMTQGGGWAIVSAETVRNAMGLGVTQDVTFNSLEAGSIVADSVSGVSGVFDNIKINDHIEGPFEIKDQGETYARFRTENDLPLVIQGKNDIIFKVEGAEKWRVSQNLLHTYGENLPTWISDYNTYGIALSGTSAKVLAANTPKVICSVVGGALQNKLGAASVSNPTTGTYTITFDADEFSPANTYYAPFVSLRGSTTTERDIVITTVTTTTITIKIYDTATSTYGDAVNADFSLVVY